MATDRLTDDESCEKLLDESVKEELDEDEEDCIKHLLNALERDEAEASEKYWEGRQLLAKDRGLMLDNNDRGNESVNASVSDLNTSKLKLDITANNVPPKGTEIKFSKISPSSDKQRRAMKLLKKHKSETGKIICGIVIMLIILGIGGSLLVLGWKMDMEDLYLLGGIFAFGGVIFTIALIVVRCQTREQLGDTDYSVLYKA